MNSNCPNGHGPMLGPATVGSAKGQYGCMTCGHTIPAEPINLPRPFCKKCGGAQFATNQHFLCHCPAMPVGGVQTSRDAPEGSTGMIGRSNRRNKRETVPHETEEGIQQRIIQALEALGYEVMVTSRRRKKCRVCGTYSSGGDGVSKGLGDLLVRHPSWPWYVRVEADVKTLKGKLSEEQERRVKSGSLQIWRSHEEAVNDVRAVGGFVGR